MVGYYDYEELKAKARSGNQEDIDNLAEWFEEYGADFWNTECFDADDFYLYPIYVDENRNEEFDDDADIFIDHYEVVYR